MTDSQSPVVIDRSSRRIDIPSGDRNVERHVSAFISKRVGCPPRPPGRLPKHWRAHPMSCYWAMVTPCLSRHEKSPRSITIRLRPGLGTDVGTSAWSLSGSGILDCGFEAAGRACLPRWQRN